MYKIAALNKISQKGLDRLTDQYTIVEDFGIADGILVRSQEMNAMDLPAGLLAIARAGAGVNNIPVELCSKKGIVVFNTPGANANAVKELVLTGLLLCARDVAGAMAWTRTLTCDVAKTVEKHKGQFAGHEIKGKTLGVVGLGAIGVMVANAASALGMNVIGYDPYISIQSAHELSSSVKYTDSPDLLLPVCDYLTIHIPYMESTRGMIGAKQFAAMKNGVCILNFSRDEIVRGDDILIAIKSGKVRKYVTDFPTEAYLDHEDVMCIPHLGASTRESEENCARMAVDQLMDYLENGNIKNSVNYPDCHLGVCATTGRIAVLNRNIPAMLGKITGILADMNINISDLNNRSKGEYAYTLIDIDSVVDEAALRKALSVDGIIAVRVVK